MKFEISRMAIVPTTVEALKKILQKLWDRIDPVEWRYLTERLTCKVEDVIKAKGIATIY